ncbi:hypothetical protein WA026_002162 [Henosepilachna vigintioctopunctata]|uniref:Uncharacterized protein n=1 Tax=Henosepilachna vigintioctopunctata TaxID=420089 RepID=A0AAW1U015_9CUCU
MLPSGFLVIATVILLGSVQSADIGVIEEYDHSAIPNNQKQARLELGYDNFKTVKSSKSSDIHGNNWDIH